MEDETPKKKSLSEISHLFLSSVRDNATGGQKPKRLPPGAPRPDESTKPPVEPMPESSAPQTFPPNAEHPMPRNVSMDLTPEEFQQMFGGAAGSDETAGGRGGAADGGGREHKARSASSSDRVSAVIGPVSAIIGAHLNGSLQERARQYAAHLCAAGERVALMEVDNASCRVTCFDAEAGEPAAGVEPLITQDARELMQALDELAWDIDRWVLLMPAPREPEARTLLGRIDHWVLLSTTDHDGVVSCYRSIKGLVDVGRPRLTLALLDPADANEAARVHRKIASVCEQFLKRPVHAEPPVQAEMDVTETPVLICQPDRAKLAVPMQWDVIADFLERARRTESQPPMREPTSTTTTPAPAPPAKSTWVADVVMPAIESPMPVELVAAIEAPAVMAETPPSPAIAIEPSAIESDITDLPGGEATEDAVLSAVLSRSTDGLVASPVHAPMCPHAVLAINRDRRLVLLAACRQGLGELRSIAQAYRWVIENRPLLSMALPQFSIDTMALPALRLLIDHADVSAELLQPMLQTGNVSVQTYRKLRWAGKTGLLLEAA